MDVEGSTMYEVDMIQVVVLDPVVVVVDPLEEQALMSRRTFDLVLLVILVESPSLVSQSISMVEDRMVPNLMEGVNTQHF